jgi:cytoskeleton protein RodZ
MSELRRRLFKVVGDSGQSEARRVEPIEEVREGIAQLLKQTRERYGQSLRDVSANLRIRLAYLQAIESGRFRELPGPTYAVGFVRSYAEYLGLDAAEIVRRFKGEVEGLDHRTHLAFPEPVPEGKMPGGALIVVSLLVLAIGYGGWYAITTRGAGDEALIPRLSASLKALVGGGAAVAPPSGEGSAEAPAAPSAPSAAESASPAPAAQSAVSPAPQAGPVSLPAPAPSAAGTSLGLSEGASAGVTALSVAATAGQSEPAGAPSSANVAGQEVAVGSTEEDEIAAEPDSGGGEASAGLPAAPALPEAPRIETAAAASTASLPPQSGGTARVILHARLASWIQISDAAGLPILTRTLLAGETLDVPVQPGLTLFTGNAGGLEITVDGRPTRSLGAVGSVRKGISLDPDALTGAPSVE